MADAKALMDAVFQSTLPARGATWSYRQHGQHIYHDFNPRSPHGERRLCEAHGQYAALYFNPRSPHGERPLTAKGFYFIAAISIHAPRTGSDIHKKE